MSKNPRVLLGEVGGAHGIRGEVVIRSFTADPADIAAYGPLESEAGAPLPALTVVRVTPKGVICRFAGISDRTAVEKLRGKELWIARDRLPPPDAGDYYHADLIGLSAVSPKGEAIGTVVAVANFGAGDLLEIRRLPSTLTEFVPFTDAVVPEVDIAGGRAVVVMPVLVGEPEPGSGGDDIDGDGKGGEDRNQQDAPH